MDDDTGGGGLYPMLTYAGFPELYFVLKEAGAYASQVVPPLCQATHPPQPTTPPTHTHTNTHTRAHNGKVNASPPSSYPGYTTLHSVLYLDEVDVAEVGVTDPGLQRRLLSALSRFAAQSHAPSP